MTLKQLNLNCDTNFRRWKDAFVWIEELQNQSPTFQLPYLTKPKCFNEIEWTFVMALRQRMFDDTPRAKFNLEKSIQVQESLWRNIQGIGEESDWSLNQFQHKYGRIYAGDYNNMFYDHRDTIETEHQHVVDGKLWPTPMPIPNEYWVAIIYRLHPTRHYHKPEYRNSNRHSDRSKKHFQDAIDRAKERGVNVDWNVMHYIFGGS